MESVGDEVAAVETTTESGNYMEVEEAPVDPHISLSAETVANMSLLQLLEVVAIHHMNEHAAFNKLRTFKITDIVLEALESIGEIRIEIYPRGESVTSIHFEGTDSSIDLACCTAAFDFVLRLLLHTNCSDARLIIEPSEKFTDELALAPLPSLAIAEDVIKIRELNWAFGAPLELYVQIESHTTTVDKIDDPNATGHAALVELIRKHAIEPRIVTLFV